MSAMGMFAALFLAGNVVFLAFFGADSFASGDLLFGVACSLGAALFAWFVYLALDTPRIEP